MEIFERENGLKNIKASDGMLIVFDKENNIFSKNIWLSRELSNLDNSTILAKYEEISQEEAENILKEAEDNGNTSEV